MVRRPIKLLAFLLFLVPSVVSVPAVVRAQGLLIVVDSEQHVRLPRPVVIHHHHHHPPIIPPRPRPRPQPEASYKIKELDINARLIDQVAQVQVSQSFVNTGSRQLEVSFVFPLPYDGAIERMTLLVNGKEYPAKLLDAKEARRAPPLVGREVAVPVEVALDAAGRQMLGTLSVPNGETIHFPLDITWNRDQKLRLSRDIASACPSMPCD